MSGGSAVAYSTSDTPAASAARTVAFVYCVVLSADLFAMNDGGPEAGGGDPVGDAGAVAFSRGRGQATLPATLCVGVRKGGRLLRGPFGGPLAARALARTRSDPLMAFKPRRLRGARRARIFEIRPHCPSGARAVSPLVVVVPRGCLWRLDAD